MFALGHKNLLNTLRNQTPKLTFFVLFLLSAVSFAEPAHYPNFESVSGGLIQLPDTAFVEGSSRMGHLQPDYKISKKDQNLKEFLKKAQTLTTTFPDPTQRMIEVLRLVRKTLPKIRGLYRMWGRGLSRERASHKSSFKKSENRRALWIL